MIARALRLAYPWAPAVLPTIMLRLSASSLGAPDARRRRRVLRLGALLFRLRYYMADPEDIRVHCYRLSADAYAQLLPNDWVLVAGDGRAERLDLEAAIALCQAALAEGCLLHQVGQARSD